ncbi:hypothetical protein GEMRC1_011813 [Eukaryota sp. GEM-RC1]
MKGSSSLPDIVEEHHTLCGSLTVLEQDFDNGVNQLVEDFNAKDAHLISSFQTKLRQQTILISKVLKHDPSRLKDSINALKETLEKKLESRRLSHAQEQAKILRELELMFQSERDRINSRLEVLESVVPSLTRGNHDRSSSLTSSPFSAVKDRSEIGSEVTRSENQSRLQEVEENMSQSDENDNSQKGFKDKIYSPHDSSIDDVSKRESHEKSNQSPKPKIKKIPGNLLTPGPATEPLQNKVSRSGVFAKTPLNQDGKPKVKPRVSLQKRKVDQNQQSKSISVTQSLKDLSALTSQKEKESVNQDSIVQKIENFVSFEESPKSLVKTTEQFEKDLHDLEFKKSQLIESFSMVDDHFQNIGTSTCLNYSDDIKKSLSLLNHHFNRLPASSVIESSLSYASKLGFFDACYDYDDSGFAELLRVLALVRDVTLPKVLDRHQIEEKRFVAGRRVFYETTYGATVEMPKVCEFEVTFDDILMLKDSNNFKISKSEKQRHQSILEQVIIENTQDLPKAAASHSRDLISFIYRKELSESNRLLEIKKKIVEDYLESYRSLENEFMMINDEFSRISEKRFKKSSIKSQKEITPDLSIGEIKKLLKEKRRQKRLEKA